MAIVINQGSRKALAFEQIAVGAAVSTLTKSKFTQIVFPPQTTSGGNQSGGGSGPKLTTNCKSALLTVETANIRITFDGTAPSTTVGHLITSGSTIGVDGFDNLNNVQMYAVSGSPVVSVSYYDA